VRDGPCRFTPVGRPQRDAKLFCARGEKAGVADEDEFAGPVDEGGCEREIRPDAGRLAGRDDDAARDQGFLIST